MQSKRGKASKTKAINKASKPIQKNRSRQRSGRRIQGSSDRTGGLGSSRTLMSAPVSNGVVLKNRMFGLRFGSAAPHDEFPEGGLRIAGVLPGSGDTAVLTQDTVKLGLWATGGSATCMISPTGTQSSNCPISLMSFAGPLAIFAQYFRRYRFRKLAAEFDSLVPTSGVLGGTGGATVTGPPIIQISHEKDPVTADGFQGSYTIDSSVQSQCCTRFNSWANEVMCPLIDEKKQSSSDELFWTTAAGDSITSTNDADLRQTCQGGVVATVSSVNGAADTQLGKLLFHFVVDLYGFTNIADDVLPSGDSREAKRSRSIANREPKQKPEGDRKDDRKIDRRYPASLPDADLSDFVDLTPKSGRLMIKPEAMLDPNVRIPLVTPPPSVSGAPKAKSLK